jgi:hypothetical protein
MMRQPGQPCAVELKGNDEMLGVEFTAALAGCIDLL